MIAGLSYELLKWAGRSDNIVVKVLSLPGLYLQKVTTKEPDDSMLEVAIAGVNACIDDKPVGSYRIPKAGAEAEDNTGEEIETETIQALDEDIDENKNTD